jgi:hypothetical protein
MARKASRLRPNEDVAAELREAATMTSDYEALMRRAAAEIRRLEEQIAVLIALRGGSDTPPPRDISR